jgi:hypothetical protein
VECPCSAWAIGGTEGYIFEAQQLNETSYYADIFGNNGLADNDSYPPTIALSNAFEGRAQKNSRIRLVY